MSHKIPMLKARYGSVEEMAVKLVTAKNTDARQQIWRRMKRTWGTKASKAAADSIHKTMNMVDPLYQHSTQGTPTGRAC